MSTINMSQNIRINEESSSLLKKPLTEERKKIIERENLGDKILLYIKSIVWICVAIGAIYYSNFFHNLFRNPKVSPLFFEICMAAYTMIILLILYTTFVLPYFYGVSNIQEFNPKLIPIGAVVGVVAVLSLLIAIWPVWGFTSILIFVALWKGFFSMAMFLPEGKFGNFLFLTINTGTVLSFYVIQHEGYFH